MVFGWKNTDIDNSQFFRVEWSASAYGECNKYLNPNDQQPKGIGFIMREFVDYDHAGELTTRRSRTGFIIFINLYPIYWLLKRQTPVEMSSFGSKFITMKQCCEYARELCYKLNIMEPQLT